MKVTLDVFPGAETEVTIRCADASDPQVRALLELLEMFAVSIAAGFSQTWLLPPTVDFNRGILFGRSALWLLLSTALCTAVSILGGWFRGLPAWCPWLLGAILLIGFACMLLGMKMEQEADTMRLNESLRQYQSKNDC